MKIEQLTGHIGAELINFDLRAAANDDTVFQEVYNALLKHRVLFLRDQHKLTRAEHVQFTKRMGELESHPILPSPPDAPGLVLLYKTADKPADRYENLWHSDNTWRKIPSKACVLRCVACPTVGGDTMWANMIAAYHFLPEDVKNQINNLRANHSFMSSLGSLVPDDKLEEMRAKWPDVEHKVVRHHPETDEKILWVNGFATHFTNYHVPEKVRYGQDYTMVGGELFRYLLSQAYIPEYQVRWRWRPNSIAIWDNRSTQHYAVIDYPPSVRQMERASVADDNYK